MQQNLYEVAVLKDTPVTFNGVPNGEKQTTLLVSPTVVLATGPQVARDKAVLLIPEAKDAALDDVRIFVREFASTYQANRTF